MKRQAAMALGLVLVLLGLLGGAALAQENSAARVRIFASLPNWAGLWETEFSAQSDNPSGYSAAYTRDPAAASRLYIKLAAKPPYNPVWARKYAAEMKRTAPKQFTEACSSAPFPALLEVPIMFEIFVTPEETLFLYEDGTARHIYTDGRKHPSKQDLWPTGLGNSIGHWEGATLVIDTIDAKAGPIFGYTGLGGADLSAEAYFTERVRMTNHDTLQDDLTIDDPSRFAHPWHVSIRWPRVLDQDRLMPTNCANNRNPVVNGKVTIAPP